MPRQQTTREDAVKAVTETFRDHGVEGASLSLLSKATGLGRSSLYHHFPDGKADMAKATLGQVGEDFTAIVLEPFAAGSSPQSRVKAGIKGLNTFYVTGKRPCFVELFGLPAGKEIVPGGAAGLAGALKDTFADLAAAAGASPKEAGYKAEHAIVELQGALVLSRALEDMSVFKRFIERLPAILLG